MTSVNTFNTAETTGALLGEQIKAIRRHRMESQGFKGFWVQAEKLDALESGLERLISGEEKTSLDMSALSSLNEELQELRRENASRKTILEASKLNEAKLKGDLEQMKRSADAMRELSQKEKADIGQTIDELKEELSSAKKSLASSRQANRESAKEATADKGALQADLKLKADEVTRLNNLLADLNGQVKGKTKAVNDAYAQVESLKARIEAESSLQKRASGMSYSDALKQPASELKPLDPIPEPERYVLKKALKSDVKTKLEDYAALKREAIRERAHKLMEIANSTDPKNFVGYKAYASVLFSKIKDTPVGRRMRFEPAIDDLWESMAFTSGKPLRAVKAQYNELFNTPVEEQEKEKASSAGSETWWQSIKFDFWWYNATSRSWYKEQKERLVGKKAQASSWFGKLRLRAESLRLYIVSFWHWGSSVVKTD